MSRPTYAQTKLKAMGFSSKQVFYIESALDDVKEDTALTADEVLTVVCGFVLDSVARERYRGKAADVPGQCYLFPGGGSCVEN